MRNSSSRAITRARVVLLVTAAALAVAGAPARAADWPGYGLDDANTRSQGAETALGSFTVLFAHKLWRDSTLKGSTGTPAIAGGVAYVTGWDGTVRALGLRTGAELWRTTVVAPGPGVNTVVDGSIAVADDLVYAGTGTGHVVALDRATGQEQWRVHAAPWDDGHVWSSPRLFGDHLVVGIGSEEVSEDKDEYVTHGAVVALDPATGDEQWRFYVTEPDGSTGAGGSVWSTAAYDAALGLVYIGTGQHVEGTNSPYTDALLALDVSTGELRWSRQYTSGDLYRIFKLPPNGVDYDIGASPNLFTAGGRPAVGVADKGGRYAVWDRATGEPIWGVQLTPGSHLGGTMQTAATAGGRVFVSSNTMADTNWYFNPSNKTTLFSLDQGTGATQWQTVLPSAAFGAITHANGVLYVPTLSGVLFAIRATDGRIVRRLLPSGKRHPIFALNFSDSLAGGVAIADGVLLAPFGWAYLVGSSDTRSGGVAAFGL